MTHLNFHRAFIVRAAFAGLVLAGVLGATAPARADHDDDWREHQRHEREAEAHSRGRAHWDHRYWDRHRYDDRDRVVEVYHPPTVYYAPPPPSGVDFVFRLGR